MRKPINHPIYSIQSSIKLSELRLTNEPTEAASTENDEWDDSWSWQLDFNDKFHFRFDDDNFDIGAFGFRKQKSILDFWRHYFASTPRWTKTKTKETTFFARFGASPSIKVMNIMIFSLFSQHQYMNLFTIFFMVTNVGYSWYK